MENVHFDSGDILLIGLAISVLFIPVCFGIKILVNCYYDNKFSQEKICVEYYKQNHYVLSECEKYSDKLNSMEENYE